MIKIIAIVFLFTSLFGLGIMIFLKIPVLITLPIQTLFLKKESVWMKLKKRFKGLLSYEIFLQKLLSKIMVLSLKTENKTFQLLKKLRMKSKIKNNLDDNYWNEIKKSLFKKKKNQ